jgi:NitT/TauT family transport system ATP-binding protein
MIIQVKDVSKFFEGKDGQLDVFSHLSFSVEKGEIVAIVGPSGSGKSTILNVLSGLIPASSGEIVVPKEIGYMFQQDELFSWRTVFENACLGLEIKHKKTPENQQKVHQLLEKYGLCAFEKKYPEELSGGMRKRLALIRTLAVNPDILFLDEPFSALDFQTRLIVSDDIYKIIRENGLSAILVTHDLSEAISLCDRVLVFSKRPAQLLESIPISIQATTPFEKRNHPQFPVYFKRIWELMKNDKV